MAKKILEIEQQGEEVILHFRRPSLRHLPKGTKSHLRTARKETLLAIRSLLDEAIERAEKEGEGKQRKRTKIEVD